MGLLKLFRFHINTFRKLTYAADVFGKIFKNVVQSVPGGKARDTSGHSIIYVIVMFLNLYNIVLKLKQINV
jgi:hypothetical protein